METAERWPLKTCKTQTSIVYINFQRLGPNPYFSTFVKNKIYDKRDDFDFDIVNFPFLDGDVPRSASYGAYISQLIRFARVSSHVDDLYTRKKV